MGDAGLAARGFPAGEEDAIPDGKGAYGLAIRLDHAVEFTLQSRDPVRLESGWLVYAGSAKGPGGIRARLRRHLRRDKALHWHVDRLTLAAVEIVAVPQFGDSECAIIDRLLQSPNFDIAVRGFGNTDCRMCESHLLRFSGWGLRP
jgi:Uri superfamily endonuclease